MIERDGQSPGELSQKRICSALSTSDAFSAGSDETVLADVEGWRVGFLICYDVEFPENVRRLALAGADFVAVPTAVMPPYDFVASHMVPTRAV